MNFETRRLTLSGSRIAGSIDRVNGLYYLSESPRGALVAATSPVVSRDRGDWQLIRSEFRKILGPFSTSTPEATFTELFRTLNNKLCDKGFDERKNAFTQTWAGGDFYGNPVYEHGFLRRTLDKALADFDASNTRIVLVVTKWPTADWW